VAVLDVECLRGMAAKGLMNLSVQLGSKRQAGGHLGKGSQEVVQ
jgi:hypothetical protein